MPWNRRSAIKREALSRLSSKSGLIIQNYTVFFRPQVYYRENQEKLIPALQYTTRLKVEGRFLASHLLDMSAHRCDGQGIMTTILYQRVTKNHRLLNHKRSGAVDPDGLAAFECDRCSPIYSLASLTATALIENLTTRMIWRGCYACLPSFPGLYRSWSDTNIRSFACNSNTFKQKIL
jgi:hypothetical protein